MKTDWSYPKSSFLGIAKDSTECGANLIAVIQDFDSIFPANEKLIQDRIKNVTSDERLSPDYRNDVIASSTGALSKLAQENNAIARGEKSLDDFTFCKHQFPDEYRHTLSCRKPSLFLE